MLDLLLELGLNNRFVIKKPQPPRSDTANTAISLADVKQMLLEHITFKSSRQSGDDLTLASCCNLLDWSPPVCRCSP